MATDNKFCNFTRRFEAKLTGELLTRSGMISNLYKFPRHFFPIFTENHNNRQKKLQVRSVTQYHHLQIDTFLNLEHKHKHTHTQAAGEKRDPIPSLTDGYFPEPRAQTHTHTHTHTNKLQVRSVTQYHHLQIDIFLNLEHKHKHTHTHTHTKQSALKLILIASHNNINNYANGCCRSYFFIYEY